MPNLVREGLTIKDVHSRNRIFKRVRIGQIFYCQGSWWSKRSLRTAVPADNSSNKPTYFKGAKIVKIFDESLPTVAPVATGESFEDFLAFSLL